MAEVELRQITKRYGELVANDAIDLRLRAGEIHALLGANGAGKTTLVNIMTGRTRPDTGQVRVPGRIGMVHQHFELVDTFTVAENIMLGREPGPGCLLDRAAGRALVHQASQRFGLELDADALVGELPVGVRQRVEVVKALVDDAEWLVLDEPTAALGPAEIDQLIEVLRRLRADGKGIVFITHRLAEAVAVADVITVLRAGRVVATLPPSTPQAELAELMVGPSQPSAAADHRQLGEVLITNRGLDVRAGEVLGLAGLPGPGQRAVVAEVLASHRDAAHIPEDRQRAGFIAQLSIAENLVLDQLADFTRHGLLQRDRLAQEAQRRADEYGISTAISARADTLSGGNQQRLVLARELSRPRRVVVACEPTRGLDVAAVGFVHTKLRAARAAGAAVLLVSSDQAELVSLADRVVDITEVGHAS